jgi:hypothetical protein
VPQSNFSCVGGADKSRPVGFSPERAWKFPFISLQTKALVKITPLVSFNRSFPRNLTLAFLLHI